MKFWQISSDSVGFAVWYNDCYTLYVLFNHWRPSWRTLLQVTGWVVPPSPASRLESLAASSSCSCWASSSTLPSITARKNVSVLCCCFVFFSESSKCCHEWPSNVLRFCACVCFRTASQISSAESSWEGLTLTFLFYFFFYEFICLVLAVENKHYKRCHTTPVINLLCVPACTQFPVSCVALFLGFLFHSHRWLSHTSIILITYPMEKSSLSRFTTDSCRLASVDKRPIYLQEAPFFMVNKLFFCLVSSSRHHLRNHWLSPNLCHRRHGHGHCSHMSERLPESESQICL